MTGEPKSGSSRNPSGNICGAKKRSGDPCSAPPIKGGTRCRRHGGASPQAQRKAAERVTEAKTRQRMDTAVKTLGLKTENVDPAEALLEEIAWTHGHVQWLRSQVQALSTEELRWGTVDRESGIGPLGVIDKTTEKAAPNVLYSMYLTERQHLAKVSALALSAGIEERRVRMAEEQGQLAAMVVRRVLDRLKLSAEQLEQVPLVVASEFRALASAANLV